MKCEFVFQNKLPRRVKIQRRSKVIERERERERARARARERESERERATNIEYTFDLYIKLSPLKIHIKIRFGILCKFIICEHVSNIKCI